MLFKTRKVAFLDGCRTPFQKVSTGYTNLNSYDLARLALTALKHRLPFPVDDVDHVIMGTVVTNMGHSNVARDAMLGAGYSEKTPAYTVTQACISANRAITNACDMISTKQAQVVIAGGTDSMSDAPIQYQKSVRKRLMAAQRARGALDYLKLLKGLKLRDLGPEIPAIAEFSTGLSMGQDADELAAKFGISREQQDEFALRSHLNAARAWEKGWMESEVTPASIPPKFDAIGCDNTFRGDSTREKLASLKPSFVRPYGTITAGNASPLTDGAAAAALISVEKARAEGIKPDIYIKAYQFAAQTPRGELLLGPAYATAKLLKETGLELADISVFEMHEAFAGQVLANLAAMDSTSFCEKNLGLTKVIGEIPMDKLNTGGGSLSLGHPFGATGARLLTTAANRLRREGGKYALISACAAGGMGSAILIERSGR